MRHYRQIAPVQKFPLSSIGAADIASARTIPEERHQGALVQQSWKRAAFSTTLAPRGRTGTCLMAVESSIVNKPSLVDWLGNAAQHCACWTQADGRDWRCHVGIRQNGADTHRGTTFEKEFHHVAS